MLQNIQEREWFIMKKWAMIFLALFIVTSLVLRFAKYSFQDVLLNGIGITSFGTLILIVFYNLFKQSGEETKE